MPCNAVEKVAITGWLFVQLLQSYLHPVSPVGQSPSSAVYITPWTKNSNEWKELPSMLWSHVIGQVDKKANRFMELQMFHLFGPLSIRFVHQSPNNQGNRISELRKYNGQLLIAYGWRAYVSEENLADLGLPNVGALTNNPSRNEQSIDYIWQL